ncbi:hypothetical protein R5R35_012043 [Gryllus longicercus]|uniref:Translation initiation factor eIF2B subunit epsilon n=1 Tax=Gryllus longicercus TaxID=2509291 RepID=A0AAN9Z5C8_9ORTH
MSNTCGNKLKSSETMKKEDVLQAVVICDNFNSWFEPVSFYVPVPLIPLVNSPILEYSLEFLSLSGVQEVILFCCSHADRFKKYIKNSKWSKRSALMSVSVMVSESCRTLGDAMRDLDAKAVIRSDFILLTADVIANIQLLPILERHRKFAKQDKGAVMTILYKEAGPGHNTRSPEDETVLAVDSSTNRILFHKKVGQTSKKIVFPLETFMDRSKTELLYNLQATRIYLCSPAVPPLFSDNFDFQSLDDFVRGILMNEEILASTIYWHCLDTAEYAAQISTWHMYQAVSHDIIHRWVYPLVPDVTLTASGERYMYLRHNVYQQKSAKLAKGCVLEEDVVLAEDTVIGENTYITSSVIGRNCVIGKNVFVSNSYLWDNVVLEDNSRVEFSVVASGTVLKNGCKLGQGCIVGPETVLDANKDIKNAYLVASTSVLKDDGNENISDRKIVKIGEKAFMYTCITEDSDSEEETKICHPSGLILDSQGESEEESDDDLTGSNDMSYRASPVPDDVNLFFNEVLDSLSRGIEDKLDCDHLILEINSSRYAYNVTVQEVNYNVVRALLSLPSSSTSFAEIKKGLAYFMPILKKYIRNDEAQKDCLQAIEDTIGGKSELWDSLPKLLHILYGNDILEEDAIMEWYNTTDETSPTATAIRKEVQPLIKWLEEADAESDSSESE